MQGKTFKMSERPPLWPKDLIGIYRIVCSGNGKIYVGKTEDAEGFRARWGKHKYSLRGNYHSCNYLQNSYNKYGESAFTFEILEICSSEDEILRREWHWMKEFDVIKSGFNSLDYTEDDFGKLKRSNIPYNTVAFELLDPSGNLVQGVNLTKFTRDLGYEVSGFQAVIAGRIPSSRGYKSTNPEFHSKLVYNLRSPDGELLVFNSKDKFCRDFSLPIGSITKIIAGEIQSYKGWTCPDFDGKVWEEKEKALRVLPTVPFELIDTDGNLHKGDDLRKFAASVNLSYWSLEHVISDRYPDVSYHGYRKPIDSLNFKYSLSSPDGKIFSFDNVSLFCRENNLSLHCIFMVVRGGRNNYEGWTLPGVDAQSKTNPRCKKINQIDLSTNLVVKSWDSITDAAEEVRGDVLVDSAISQICRCLKGRRPSAKGFRWEYNND